MELFRRMTAKLVPPLGARSRVGVHGRATYPLDFVDHREMDPGYQGPVFIWDIDKTYLDTHFSSVKGMARIPFELAVDKHPIVGMPEVLRGLRHGGGKDYAGHPLYFVTASPPQVRPAVERRMLLDGIEYDGILCKDWLRTLAQGRPGRLVEQVGFKLCALLSAKGGRPLSHEYLFGDDVEADAQAYTIYADLISGRLRGGDVDEVLSKAGVARDDRRIIHSLLDGIPLPAGPVEAVFIYLAQRTDPSEFHRYGPLVRPVRCGYQLALALFDMGLVPARTVRQVRGLVEDQAEKLESDAVTRGLVAPERLAALD